MAQVLNVNETVVLIQMKEQENYFQYIALLGKYKNADNDALQFFIGKEYYKLNKLDIAKEILYKCAETSDPALNFLEDNYSLLDHAKMVFVYQKRANFVKLRDVEKCNLVICKCEIRDENKLLELICSIQDEFYRLQAQAKYDKTYKDKEIVLESLNQLLKCKPEHTMSNYEFGKYYMQAGEYEKAIPYFKKAGELIPAVNCLSAIYFDKGEYKLAYETLFISLRQKNDLAMEILQMMFDTGCDEETAKILVDLKIYEGLIFLIKLKKKREEIIAICLNKLVFELNEECQICYEVEKYFIKLKCGHDSCSNCVYQYNNNFKKCPVCRAEKVLEGYCIFPTI